MKLYGLIGYPLGHSFSKKFFSDKFEKENLQHCRYENFPIDKIGKVKDIIIKNPDLQGLNVTIPYKESIIPFLDHLDEPALKISAVNTLKVLRKGSQIRLEGYNTDIIGFRESLIPLLRAEIQSALILGSGGASKAVSYVLEELNISYLIVSRKAEGQVKRIPYQDLSKKIIENHLLIVNTTPLGTWPDTHLTPEIPWVGINRNHLLYDLIYNPSETEFLKKGKERGTRIKNGLEMLEKQALASWDIWNR